jgi:predicted Zn-dependent protease
MRRLSAGKKKPPEFLSTHPADINRIRKIKERIPVALAHYGKSSATKQYRQPRQQYQQQPTKHPVQKHHILGPIQ